MAPREVVLHIGAFKTGTSFIQSALSLNKAALAESGVLFPGSRWPEQVHATRALNARPSPDAAEHDRGADAWDSIAEECRSWRGERAIISMEFLSGSRPEAVREAVRSLAPARVRIVLGARDLSHAIPAQWQESLQSGGRTWTLGEYASEVRRPVGQFGDATKHFWRKHNWQRILARWGQVLPSEQLTMLTFPRPGSSPEVLWHRFGVAAGFDAASYPIPAPSNESLGASSLEVARRINLAAVQRGTSTRGNPVYRRVLCKRVMAQRRPQERAVVLPPDALDWTAHRTEQLIRKVQAISPVVIGDLDDLRPRAGDRRDGATWQPELIDEAEIAVAADEAATGLAAALQLRRDRPTGADPQSLLSTAVSDALAMVTEQAEDVT